MCIMHAAACARGGQSFAARMKMGSRLARLAKGCSTSYPIAKYASGMPSSRFHRLTQT